MFNVAVLDSHSVPLLAVREVLTHLQVFIAPQTADNCCISGLLHKRAHAAFQELHQGTQEHLHLTDCIALDVKKRPHKEALSVIKALRLLADLQLIATGTATGPCS